MTTMGQDSTKVIRYREEVSLEAGADVLFADP
jgi:hypothetical protein